MRFDPVRWRQAQFDLAIEVYLLSQEHQERVAMTFTGFNPEQIKAVVAETQQKAQARIAAAMDTYNAAASRAATAIPAALETFATKIERETDAQLHALATWTNGEEFEVDPDKKPAPPTTTPPAVNLIEPATAAVAGDNGKIIEQPQ